MSSVCREFDFESLNKVKEQKPLAVPEKSEEPIEKKCSSLTDGLSAEQLLKLREEIDMKMGVKPSI